MRPKIEGLIDPGHEHRLAVMRTAMARAGVSAVPTNREQRRRLNAELRALGAPELQVGVPKAPILDVPQKAGMAISTATAVAASALPRR